LETSIELPFGASSSGTTIVPADWKGVQESFMALYFFDIDDGEEFIRDMFGVECASREDVRRNATRGLAEVVQDEIPDGNQRLFQVRVRNEEGQYIFEASLALCGRWID
jgi:hypothetical protein